MISVIISSASSELLAKVSANIRETIGVPYEIIAVGNSDGKMGICEAYNRGARQAKYDLLCFMHEDVRIITSEWGKIVTGLFRKPGSPGLVGVAGSTYKSLAPSGWYFGEIDLAPTLYRNIIQFFKYTGKPPVNDYCNPGGKLLKKVASVDGVWFCVPKNIALEFPFDEKLLEGFHGYDIDFSISVGSRYDVAVTFEVLLEHFSEGRFGNEWFDAILKLHKKWAYRLPLNVAGLDEGQLWTYEKKAFKRVLCEMRGNGYSAFSLYRLIWNSRRSRMMRRKLLWLKLAFFAFRLTVLSASGK